MVYLEYVGTTVHYSTLLDKSPILTGTGKKFCFIVFPGSQNIQKKIRDMIRKILIFMVFGLIKKFVKPM
jgi:hypothetical protein